MKVYCLACHPCSINKKSNTKRKAQLGRYPEVTKYFGRVHIELTGPIYSNTETDFKYIATFQDYFSKYVVCTPVVDAKAITVAQAFIDDVVLIHRVPEVMITDNGVPYTSALMVDICKLLKIRKLNGTSYHAQGNSQIERFHHTLKTMLRHFVNPENLDWAKMIKYVAFGPQWSAVITICPAHCKSFPVPGVDNDFPLQQTQDKE